MKKTVLTLLLGAIVASAPLQASGGVNEDAINRVITNYLPGTTGFAIPKVDKLNINNKSKTIEVRCGISASYLSLTPEALDKLKSDIKAALPAQYSNYKVKIYADGESLDNLALFAGHKIVRPTETKQFVTRNDRTAAPKGLDGSNIGLWQSHGLYYQGDDQWGWQRPRLFQTCEDLFTQSFVMPFLMPMLENAGAYVMSPRERDTNTLEYVVDNDHHHALYHETKGDKGWSKAPNPGFAHDGKPLEDYQNPFRAGTARQAQAVKPGAKASTAAWNANIDRDDLYAVYVSYQSLPNSATDAQYTVNAADGPHHYTVNQQMGGGTWIYLGHFPLKAGEADQPIVVLSNVSADNGAVVTADAVKIGGGMGNVARRPAKVGDDGVEHDYMVSGYPRFTEGARYWLQWAGAPDSVYSATKYENEYNDDYRSRGYWINWLAGGSSVLPKEQGLGIPLDLSFAFHSDAGITPNDSIIGTLGIYCTDNTDTYPNGTSRLAARDLTDLVLTNICEDVRATMEPQWTRRGMWNRSYAEARVPQVPAMLLELMSHQNFADMRYGLDPSFRFVVSRAIYKAMLQYIAQRDGRDYVVQPLPVQSFAIQSDGSDTYTLTWDAREDQLEPTATPTYYIVEHRPADGLGFTPVATVSEPRYSVKITDSDIHSYRIVAANEGGVSFPSEVLALCHRPGKKQVLVVNGFTRVSGPESYDYGDMAGFYNSTDPGVAYIKDIMLVGEQFEHRRDIPWMANEVAGFGASFADYEDKVVAGNTFDYVALHGESIVKAGCGFISSSAQAFEEGKYQGSKIAMIDLILGNQKEIQVGSGRYGTKYKSFSGPMQQQLAQMAANGTAILVTGSYIATDLWNNPYSSEAVAKADQAFAKDVLGYVWRSGKATPDDKAIGVKTRFKAFDDLDVQFNNQLSYDCYAVISPGSIAPGSKDGAAVMRYTPGNLPAATAYQGPKHRAVAVGFPFETIQSEAQRDALMHAAIKFLLK